MFFGWVIRIFFCFYDGLLSILCYYFFSFYQTEKLVGSLSVKSSFSFLEYFCFIGLVLFLSKNRSKIIIKLLLKLSGTRT